MDLVDLIFMTMVIRFLNDRSYGVRGLDLYAEGNS